MRRANPGFRCRRQVHWRIELGRDRLGLFAFVLVPFFWRGIAPRIRLRTRHNAGNIRVFAGVSFFTCPAARACFGPSCGLFLLLFGASALAFALAARQWIPCSHLKLL